MINDSVLQLQVQAACRSSSVALLQTVLLVSVPHYELTIFSVSLSFALHLSLLPSPLHLAAVLTLLQPTLAFYCPTPANFLQFVVEGVRISSFGCLCRSHLNLIRSTRALITSSRALIAFIDVLSLCAPPIEHFIITLLLHLFIYILQYSMCQALCQ